MGGEGIPKESSLSRIRVVVSGRVQGVGFRWFVHRVACARGLAGWVRNRADGSVEMEAEGASGQLAGFEALVKKGPVAARVAAFQKEEIPATGGEGFEITH